ncbi:hypothetical protein [Parasediminibacterium sp. JCM 36343]|uniref:hypothetical protein n=1 Tax=Parasediminibacterium sp. JCM 36343 TaxID=3374279 RepID=UPI00397964B1
MDKITQNNSRFISLHGLSGIVVGICALTAGWAAHQIIDVGSKEEKYLKEIISSYSQYTSTMNEYMGEKLFLIAIVALFAALFFSFYFTHRRNKKNNQPIWHSSVKGLLITLFLPVFIGALLIIKLIAEGAYGFITPCSLIFYGLGLVNACKYLESKAVWVGYGQIAVGLINIFVMQWGLYEWAFGFGILHLVYGCLTWYKYDRHTIKSIKSKGKW